MKKHIFVLASLLTVCLALSACASRPGGTEGERPSGGGTGTSRVLTAYFSATGTTKGIAEKIAARAGGTLYEIAAADPYTAEDLDYRNDGSRANREQADRTARPAIAGSVEDMVRYDIVFLGYPIWHGQAPRIVSTFLESYDFTGKTIVPFCTSGGSGMGSSGTALHPLAGGANWLEGRRFSAGADAATVAEWIDGLDLRIGAVSRFDLASGVNGKAPSVMLNSGYSMPVLGLGTYAQHGDTVKNSVTTALRHGVRLFDTAYMYGNEAEIGQAIRASGVPREEIFVITKIYPGEQFANPQKAVRDALDKLDLGYIDMMLLHHPGANDVRAYKAMETFVAQGKIRSLGLSNWYIEEIDDFIAQVDTMPALIQNEIHPYYQEKQVVPYMHDLGIVMQAWYPFGGRGHTGALLTDPAIVEIARAHNVSSAQVILRWHLQRGVSAIPGSSDPEHIAENISVFEFALDDAQMQAIAALDRNEKHDWY